MINNNFINKNNFNTFKYSFVNIYQNKLCQIRQTDFVQPFGMYVKTNYYGSYFSYRNK